LTAVAETSPRAGIWPYIQIARTDHWFKNAFMALGVILALFYAPERATVSLLVPLGVAILATCLVASSNYVPVPSGQVKPAWAVAEWLLLAVAGLALASTLNVYFLASAVWLWVMGIAYNVPPLRTKEWPYLDVLSESVNNPIRLLLGWFAIVQGTLPPMSLVLSYWMVGAFFMAMKRYAEYRHIGDPTVAGAYRRSFKYYTEERLLISLFFYATSCALFAGIFVVRYHVELILFVPFAAGLFAYYMKIGLLPNSPVQNPEKLYRQGGFLAYLIVCFVAFVALMFTSVPVLYDWFNVEPSGTAPLWTIGEGLR
jgi:decaprenyl-phosphate phosphoribosyltransferase